MKIALKNVRLAFPSLFVPTASEDGKQKKYKATLIIDPANPVNDEISKALNEVAKLKWKDKAGTVLAKLRDERRLCFSRLQKTNKSGEVYDGFEGKHWLSASSDIQPGIFDVDRSKLTQEDGKPYAGCYVNANVELWAQDNKHGMRINATLRGVQFLRDGDAFSSARPAVADEFEDMSAEVGAGDVVDV